MPFDPNVAHITIGNTRYQVLKPEEIVSVEIGLDENNEPIMEDQPLPREWDEEATMALVRRDHPVEEPQPEPVPVYSDVTD